MKKELFILEPRGWSYILILLNVLFLINRLILKPQFISRAYFKVNKGPITFILIINLVFIESIFRI